MILSRFKPHNLFGLALATYGIIRLFSYFFQPESLVNSIVSAIIVLAALILIYRRDNHGWLIVALEIILGGSGNFLSVGSLSLRTILLIGSLTLYAFRNFPKLQELWQTERTTVLILGCFNLAAGLAAVHGLLNHHALHLVIADTIPYLFSLYYFPARELLRPEEFKKWCLQLIPMGTLGKLIFTLGTFIVFSAGLALLQGPYYHWFRDVANGKITDLGFNFFRTVLNEHLLTIPLLLFSVGKKIYLPPALKKGFAYYLSYAGVVALTVILAVNLTRIYYLALIVGLVALASFRYARRWITWSVVCLALIFGSFTTIHTLASHGESFGWEIFGLRLQSIASPSLEDSSLSRLLLLPKIIEKIQAHPLIGYGLGDQVTVYSPVLRQTITTPQFDWGYLEMVDEFGLLGLFGWFLLAGLVIKLLWQIRSLPTFRIMTACLLALSVINLTSPGLFHVLGVLWIALTLCEVQFMKDQLTLKPKQ
jgi:hypothetical protein